MKICVLHNSTPGGAERLVAEVARRLAKTDEVSVCTWGDEPGQLLPEAGRIWEPGPRVHLPSPIHPFGNLVRSYIGSARAARTIDSLGFDAALVLACQWGQAPEALRRLRTPHVYFAQEGRRRNLEPGYLPTQARRGWQRGVWAVGRTAYDAVGSRLDRRAITAAQAVATNSSFTANELARAYGIAAPVIELGVDTEKFRPGPARRRPPYALLVGGLDPTKGGHLAIESLAQLGHQLRPELRVVANRGDPSYAQFLLSFARDVGVSVEFLQHISDDELVLEYQQATVVLALALMEPFGLTVLEASACGTPTVAVAEGGFLSTLDANVNGILVNRDPGQVARAIEDLLTGARKFDSVRMAEWTDQHWAWERTVKSLRALLVAAARTPASPLKVAGAAERQFP